MHEISLATEILRIIEANAKPQGEGTVKSVRLRIGDLSGVVPDTLRFALEVCAKGTRCEGMAVNIVHVPVTATCRRCRKEWEFAAGEMTCPECASHDITLQGGNDLAVESFEIQSADA